MQNERLQIKPLTDSDFRTVLFLWQADPDSERLAEAMNGLLERAGNLRFDIVFKIKDQIFESSEARRSITRTDLEKFAKKEEDFWTFHFVPKRSEVPNILVTVTDLFDKEDRGLIDKFNFVVKNRLGDNFTTVGVFRPHEIESITIQ